EYPGLSFQRSPVCACSLVSSLLLSGATMSQQSSLTQSAHSVRQVLTAYMANAKSIGWAIYAAGFVIWLFGYLSTGHAVAFDWDVVAPSWISSFVPNLEAEFGLALMFASMIPIYWRAGRKRP